MRGYERQKCDKALWKADKTKPRVELRGALFNDYSPADFESAASTNFATQAWERGDYTYIETRSK